MEADHCSRDDWAARPAAVYWDGRHWQAGWVARWVAAYSADHLRLLSAQKGVCLYGRCSVDRQGDLTAHYPAAAHYLAAAQH
jgi:hypothetical protein